MATEYWLRRADGQPFGSFTQAQELIRREFPTVAFAWTTSGRERIRQAEARGSELSPELRESFAGMASFFEGYAEGAGFSVIFDLGTTEPVTCLRETPLGLCGLNRELRRGLAALEAEAGAEFTWADDE